jgi:NAD(P)-dependent dehydrogenase (short-subunit alcohol dehydrogenase family)
MQEIRRAVRRLSEVVDQPCSVVRYVTELTGQGTQALAVTSASSVNGTGSDESMADAGVAEIARTGSKAVASHPDVATGEGARVAVETAVGGFGGLDVLVTSAGVVRARTLIKMDEAS